MSSSSGDYPAHPGERLAEAARRFGESRVALWGADLITQRVDVTDPTGIPLQWFGGLPGAYHLDREASGNPEPDYWPRVWGARGLLYVWADSAEPSVLLGLADEAWRVREMCAKVARLRELGAAGDRLAELCADDVPRVRVAAVRALAHVGEAEHVPALHRAADDPELSVVAAAEEALEQLSKRLDRELE